MSGQGTPASGGVVRLASIGLGWWGDELASAVGRSGAGRIVSCFARSESTRRHFAAKHGCGAAGSVREVLDDDAVDGLILATPHSTHLPLIRAAAGAGKHVFVEKPLALSVGEARGAVAAARAAGVILQVGHHRRKLAATRALRRHIDDGDFGVVHLVEAKMIKPTDLSPPEGWRGDAAECPLGGMTALGVHMIDNILYLAGPIREIYATSRRLLGRSDLDDVTTLALELESGALATLTTSLVLPRATTVAVHGTGGSGWSEDDGTALFLQAVDDDTPARQFIGDVDALAEQMREFAMAIRTGARPEVAGEDGLEVVAVLEAARISAKVREPVAVAAVRSGALAHPLG